MNSRLLYYALFVVVLLLVSELARAQCFDAPNFSGGTFNSVTNQWEIACDAPGAPFTVSTSLGGQISGSVPASSIQWSNGASGSSFGFTPDCNQLGPQSFTPCLPAGTTIPQQCFTIDPNAFDDSVPAGGSSEIVLNIDGFCYVPGATYDGALAINLSGSGDVSLSVQQPDGMVQGPLTFAISLINDLSPVPLSLLGLNTDPNGTWIITIEDAGAGAFSFDIQPGSELCIQQTTTNSVVCGDPVTVNVFGGCPTFLGAQADVANACSGESFNLSATLDPAGAPNVTYQWSGPGIDAANENLPSPLITETNTTCDPVTLNYTLSMTCTNNGSSLASNVPVSVTLYPEVDPNAVSVDNTTNIQDPDCSIIVDYPTCPNFTINGQTGPVEQNFSSGDNGTNASFVISSGGGCEYAINPTITCFSNCNLADVDAVVNPCTGGNFTIDITVNDLGDASSFDLIFSDGSVVTVNSTGALPTFGPYPSGTVVNIKLVDPNDPSCNQNLGYFTENCFDCPNLVSIDAIGPDVCGNSIVNLVANVDQGVAGVDYSIQWYENGAAIPGAVLANYPYIVNTSDPCAAQEKTYTAVLTCLNNGTVADDAVTSLDSDLIMVYPIPQLGTEFNFGNCSVTPVDNCQGALTVNINGATDPAPGASTVVNYEISVAGAPASCVATGSYTVNCANCDNDPGNGLASEKVVCWNGSIDISNPGALTTTPGFEVGYVISTDHPSTYADLNDLIANGIGAPLGPFAAPGSYSDSYTNNGTILNPTDACGELVYFTPFVSFVCQNGRVVDESGSFFAPAAEAIGTPGLGGGAIAIPTVPFCDGLVSYNLNLCVEDVTVDTQEPLAEDALFGLIDGLPGGVFSNFPNLDDIHDSCDEFLGFCTGPECYAQNGWTQDPSGEVLNIVMAEIFTFGEMQLDYDFTLDVFCDSAFPTVCTSCEAIGAPVAVRFMPDLQLESIDQPDPICDGDAIDLTALTPNPDIAGGNGTYAWWEGNASEGNSISDPTNLVPPVGNTLYCVTYSYCETGECVEETCTTIRVRDIPVLTAPTPPEVCPGESVDFTALESEITTDSGSFNWYIGGLPDAGGALLGNPSDVVPLGSESYCAVFTNAASPNCGSSICFSVVYNSLPVLLASSPEICVGDETDLTEINPSLNPNPGTFTWYDDDPLAGGQVITNTLVMPTASDVYWVTFTDDATGCTNRTSITFTINPLPVINTPAPAPVCPGTTVNLVDLESSVTTDPGTFTWFDNSDFFPVELVPDGNGNVEVTLTSNITYSVSFTDENGCTTNVSFLYEVSPLPSIADPLPAPTACADSGPFNLTDLEASISAGNGFDWYDGDPNTTGLIIADPTMVAINNATTETFYAIITDPNTTCSDTISIDYQIYDVLSGGAVSYDCEADAIVVDYTNVVGGDGGPYSSVQEGTSIPEGTSTDVIIVDGSGCEHPPIQVNKICVCDAEAGNPVAAVTQVCEGESSPAVTVPADAAYPTATTIVYTFIVTDPNTLTDNGEPTIVDFANNGGYDFSAYSAGDQLCFTGLIYDAEEFAALLTVALADPTFGPILGGLGITPASTLQDLFVAVNPLFGPLDIPGVLDLLTNEDTGLPSLVPGVIPPCLDFSDTPYCIDVVSCACTNPDVSVTAVCGPDPIDPTQYYIDVVINDLGSNTSFTISDDVLNSNVSAAATGTYQLGPFTYVDGTQTVTVTLTGDDDPNCGYVETLPEKDCNCPAVAGNPDVPDEICLADLAAGIGDIAVPADAEFSGAGTIVYVWVLVDGPGGLIIDVVDNTSELDFTGLALNESVCVQGVIYDGDEVEDILTAILADPLGGVLGGLGVTATTTLPELYDILIANADLLAGFGIEVTDVASLLVLLEETLPTAFPVDAPCLDVSDESCITVINCSGGCVNPDVVYTPICVDGDDDNFYISVTITNMGAGNNTYTISNDGGVADVTGADGSQTYQIGPFANNSAVNVTVTGEDDNSCGDSMADLTTDCTPPPCTDPTATFTALCVDGDGANFYVDVTITDMGTQNTTYTISNDGGVADVTGADDSQTYQVGPFANGTNVTVTLTGEDDNNCSISQADLTADCAPCENPTVTYTPICQQGNTAAFFVEVDITGLGTGNTSYTITNDGGAAAIFGADDSQIALVGPFSNGTTVGLTLAGEQDTNCGDSVGGLTNDCTPSCTNPTATFTPVCVDGDNDNFYIDVAITNMGTGNSTYAIFNDGGAATINGANGSQVYQVGPFSNDSFVALTLAGEQDNTCSATQGNLTGNCASGACTNPSITYAPVCVDGDDNNFYIDVSILTLGNGNTTYSITNDGGAAAVNGADNSQTYQIGPFANGTNVAVTVTGEQDNNCGDVRTNLTQSCSTTCLNPTVSYTPICVDGDENNFYIEVDISSMGQGNAAYTITNDGGAVTIANADDSQIYVVGPFANDAVVEVILTGEDDATCGGSASGLTNTCFVPCSNPTVTYAPVCLDGDTDNFYIDVIITSMGTKNSTYTITNDGGAATVNNADDSQTYQIGPFSNGANVTVSLTGEQDTSCGDSRSGLIEDCSVPLCSNPTATYSTICKDGDTDNFYIIVEITDIGTINTSYTISNDGGVADVNGATDALSYEIGPFANNASVTVTLTGEQDTSCGDSQDGLTKSCQDCINGPCDAEPGVYGPTDIDVSRPGN